jgi:hypothetical protein
MSNKILKLFGSKKMEKVEKVKIVEVDEIVEKVEKVKIVEVDEIVEKVNNLNLNDIKIQIDNLLINFNKSELENIQYEKTNTKNYVKSFCNVGNIGEELTLLIYPNSVASGSKGGCSFDNLTYVNNKIISAREVKTVCLIQTKECKTCYKKAPFFQNICYFCKKSNFKFITDSRFSINCKSHFEYYNLLECYIFIIISYKDDILSIVVYKINSNNKYFDDLLRNQKDNSKSPTCNLLPYSYDFYLSGPIKLLEYLINNKNEITEVFYDILNEKNENIPVDIFNKNEKITLGIPDKTEFIEYNTYKHLYSLRHKNFNKPRGKTTRV